MVNVAIELNGQPPLQVYIKPSDTHKIILRSIDLGAMEVISSWDELRDYNKVGSPFSIPKAALALADLSRNSRRRLMLLWMSSWKLLVAGWRLPCWRRYRRVPVLGTSSILAATVLGAISDFLWLGLG